MNVVAYKSVGLVSFGIGRADLVNLLGAPESEEKSRIWAFELRYPAGVYRFDSVGQLKEISVDVPVFEVDGESILFENLRTFLEQRDKEIFERVGFLVSPRFGLAFDHYFPSWVTAFPREELQLWRSIGSKN
ncbi:hypothetical protein H8K33_17435 [Undibacterium amnicola]|uniref:Uncharacterized protein n=1 Tax=Undibacterium amnicola TaxID=1834038 RepID=A0ABR6XV09_9BURK|nr:hypothetical protein [Undibacterium amnicola]MBC3833297.1 hypothetical protein [Undibacterium amnicola]